MGARQEMIAFNLVIDGSPQRAKQIAKSIRYPGVVRSLGLDLGGKTQVSTNLLQPDELGPLQAYQIVSSFCRVVSCELVGLIPARTLGQTPRSWWTRLGLDEGHTIESRL